MKKLTYSILMITVIIFLVNPLSSNAGSGYSGRGHSGRSYSGGGHSGRSYSGRGYQGRGYHGRYYGGYHGNYGYHYGHYGYWYGGWWYPWVGIIPFLPAYYQTMWIGGYPYYYADGDYYAPTTNGYMAVNPQPQTVPPQAGQQSTGNRLLSCLSTPVMVRVRSNRRRTDINVTAGLLAKLTMIRLSQLAECRRSRKMQIINVRWGRVLMLAGTVQNRDVAENKMRRYWVCLICIFILITSVSPVMGADHTIAVPAPGPVVIPAYNYVVGKLGAYIPTSNDLSGYDTGFNSEFAFGHYFNPYLAIELGAGYFQTEGNVTVVYPGATYQGNENIEVVP